MLYSVTLLKQKETTVKNGTIETKLFYKTFTCTWNIMFVFASVFHCKLTYSRICLCTANCKVSIDGKEGENKAKFATVHDFTRARISSCNYLSAARIYAGRISNKQVNAEIHSLWSLHVFFSKRFFSLCVRKYGQRHTHSIFKHSLPLCLCSDLLLWGKLKHKDTWDPLTFVVSCEKKNQHRVKQCFLLVSTHMPASLLLSPDIFSPRHKS